LKNNAEGISEDKVCEHCGRPYSVCLDACDEMWLPCTQEKCVCQSENCPFNDIWEETHTYKELTLENLPKESLINMIKRSSDLIIFPGDPEDSVNFSEEDFVTVGEIYQSFIDGVNVSRQKFPDAYADQKNAESPLEESPLTADPLTEDPSDMGGPSDTFSFRAEARRWRLPKTSKGTHLYAKRDSSGKFTDIQNVARATRTDRAQKAKTHGVASGQGSSGERAHGAEGARRWRLPKTSKGTALYAKRDAAGKFKDIQNVARATRIDRAQKAKTHGVASGQGSSGERAHGAEARRWRLPKTSKGTALYAKRDEEGKFTDIQNVARATRTDRAMKAKTHGVKSGHGDQGERAKANPDFLEQIEAPFRKISDMVSEILDAEDSNLMSCANCDTFWAECDCKGSEYYEASGSNYMKPKDAAAIFAKNKNRLCSVTFTKKDGSTRTLTGRTGVFRARDGSTIVGKGRKPTWDAKARSKAGFITMWDQQAARKAGDNRSGFRVVNLHTISGIRAMGRNYDAANPKGY